MEYLGIDWSYRRAACCSLSDAGVIVGWYDVNIQYYGFAMLNGNYYSYQYPGAVFTSGAAVNSLGAC